MQRSDSDAAVQAQVDRPRRDLHDRTDEAPRTPAFGPAPSLEPMPLRPPMTPQSLLASAPAMPEPVKRERDVPNEIGPLGSIDRSLTAQTDGAGMSSNATHVVERIERVMIEHDRADHGHIGHARPEREGTTLPIGVGPAVNQGATRAPATAAPIIERVEPDRAERERDTLPIEIRSAANSESLPTRPTPSIEPTPIVERTLVQRVIIERERMDQGHAVQPSAAQLSAVAMPAPGVSEARNAARLLVTPIVERVQPVRENSDQGQINRSSEAQRSQLGRAESRRSQASQAPTPPTIHVTIGRIEVRATPPPSPIKRAAPAATTMSLEEYLRSRSGDRR